MHRLGALQVGDNATGDAHEIVRCDREHIVPRSGRRPHLVVLQQVGINEHKQLGAVTERGHATGGFGNSQLWRS